jgi:hypothetical protein
LPELNTQPDISPLEIKTNQLEPRLNHQAIILPRNEVLQYLVEIPYLGFASSKGRGNKINIVLSEQEPEAQAQKISALSETLESTIKRGYTASTLFGLRGEGSAASAFSGVLCFMPCHWAAYAATAAKLAPFLGYAALKQQPSCCNPETTGDYMLSLAVDAVFWSTIGLLALGSGRRIFRRSATKEAAIALRDNYFFEEGRPVLGESIATSTPAFYSEIDRIGTAAGLSQMISELSSKEYVRPGGNFGGKITTPVRRGLKKAALSIADNDYKLLKRDVSNAYSELAVLTRRISDDSYPEEQSILRQISRHYASEAAHRRSSFTPNGLAAKTLNFIKGFAHNNCVYRST